MSEKIGSVIKTFDNKTAEVMVDKKSARGECRDISKCKSRFSREDKIVAIVTSEAGASPGDLVWIAHTTNAIFDSAALFYGVPVIGLMVGDFLGTIMSLKWGLEELIAAALIAITGLVVALLGGNRFHPHKVRAHSTGATNRRHHLKQRRVMQTSGHEIFKLRPMCVYF